MADIFLRFAQRPRWQRFLLLAVCGGLAGLGQAPTDLWPATVAGLTVAMLAHRASGTAGSAAFHAWAFGFGYFAFVLRWIVEPFFVDLARHGWMAPFAILLMASGGALFWSVATYLSARVAPRHTGVFGLALVWAEVARSLILTGFPWGLLGHIWVTTPLAQLSAIGGPHLLTVLAVGNAWGLMMLLYRRWAAIVLIAVPWAAAFAPAPVSAPDPDAPVVRIVQPNAPQHQKWDPAFRDIFLDRLLDYTADGPVPDLVVWPETAVPTLLNYIQDDLSVLSDAARGAALVFGIQRIEGNRAFHNSLVLMGQGGVLLQVYDKRHLVPFGEYIPGGALATRLGLTGLADNLGGGFAPGTEQALISIPGIGQAVPLICYEGIFAEEIYRGPERPRMLMLITNDAWFGQAAGPFQHLAQARLRAIEQGLPMIRAANTGISAMIDGYGRVTRELPLGVDGVMDVPLPPALPRTPYSRFGDAPLWIGLILLTVCVCFVRSRLSN